MAAMVTGSMGRYDVIRGVAAAVLLGFQVLGRATERATGTREKTQLFWRGLPHRKAAVVAAAGLGKKGEGAKGFEALLVHQELRNRKDSRASFWRTSGTRPLRWPSTTPTLLRPAPAL